MKMRYLQRINIGQLYGPGGGIGDRCLSDGVYVKLDQPFWHWYVSQDVLVRVHLMIKDGLSYPMRLH